MVNHKLAAVHQNSGLFMHGIKCSHNENTPLQFLILCTAETQDSRLCCHNCGSDKALSKQFIENAATNILLVRTSSTRPPHLSRPPKAGSGVQILGNKNRGMGGQKNTHPTFCNCSVHSPLSGVHSHMSSWVNVCRCVIDGASLFRDLHFPGKEQPRLWQSRGEP